MAQRVLARLQGIAAGLQCVQSLWVSFLHRRWQTPGRPSSSTSLVDFMGVQYLAALRASLTRRQ
jgi:hypothetical protein